MRDEDTIIAQATPQGKGAIALLRLSGKNCFEIVNKISKLLSKDKIDQVPSHTIKYGWILDQNNQHIDQVLFSIMKNPKTFTGEDTVEITCHNNPFIIEAIINQALFYGARIAQEGEFTRRAIQNGKLDLIQAESINELINSQTQLALKKSLSQVEGSFSHKINDWEKIILKALAFCQASFEFLDEEIDFAPQIKKNLEELVQDIINIDRTFNQQQHIKQGIRIALIGSVNSGKSSLFNILLGHPRAIVTDQPGTTRDTLEAGLYKNGNYWTLIDTAGLRTTKDIIEQEGIRRSFLEAQKADIILLIFDSSRKITEAENLVYKELIKNFYNKIIIIKNKADLPQALSNPELETDNIIISASTCTDSRNSGSKYSDSDLKKNILIIEEEISKKISILFETLESPFLLNKRQFNIINTLKQKIQNIILMLENTNVQYELVAYHLQDALEHSAELTGKSITEDAMDKIFKEFCVGK